MVIEVKLYLQNVEQLTPSTLGLKLDTNVSHSTVQNSPIMSKLNSMDSSKFSVNTSYIEVSSSQIFFLG